jgi:hypothetical protein
MSVNSTHANLEALEGWMKQLKKEKGKDDNKNKTRGKKK